MVVLLAIPFSKIYIPLGTDAWVAGPNWYHHLLRWDSEWYNLIATEGYRYNGNPNDLQTVVFYPLYPLLTRAVAAVTGLGAPEALLIVANVSALAAVVLLFKLVREEFDDRIALLTIAFLSFFPSSIFLSAGYTEPLTLLLIVCFFLALKREWFFAAAAIAGLAVAARSTGIVLLPVLLWQMARSVEHRIFWRNVLPCAVLATSGLWFYILYLWHTFDAPFAFSQAQAGFHNGTTMVARLISSITLQPFFNMNLTEASPAGLDAWFFILFSVLIVRAWFRLSTAMTLFALGVLLLPYLTLSGGPAGFISMARFNVVSFPLFLVMAEIGSRIRWLVPGVIGISGGLLFMYAALFAQWQWVG